MARGERTIGLKTGFTSTAKMVQMGVSDQICGRLTDAIADNASSAGFVLSPWIPCPAPASLLNGLAVSLRINGQLRQSGSTADILGDPLRSLAAAARLAVQTGAPLQAGDIVLAGAATPAEALAPGQQVEASVAGLGTASFSVR